MSLIRVPNWSLWGDLQIQQRRRARGSLIGHRTHWRRSRNGVCMVRSRPFSSLLAGTRDSPEVPPARQGRRVGRLVGAVMSMVGDRDQPHLRKEAAAWGIPVRFRVGGHAQHLTFQRDGNKQPVAPTVSPTLRAVVLARVLTSASIS